MAATLQQRFKQFMASVPAMENLDEIIPADSFPGKQRADYLFDNRRIIIELKSLQTDTSPKVDKELDRHRNRDDFPLIYGTVDLQKVLKHLPDGKNINHKIYRSVTRSIDEGVRDAEHQIDDTKEICGLPGSAGCLVMLNEAIAILDPVIVARRISELICCRKNRSSSTSSIDVVWLLFESHPIKFPGCSKGYLSTLLEGTNAAQAEWAISQMHTLQEQWAKFNNLPLNMVHGIKRMSEMVFESIPKSQSTQKIKRYEVEYAQYDAMPYLRDFSDEQLRTHGETVFKSLTAFFMNEMQSEAEGKALKLAWSHFLREANHRGLDLKYLKSCSNPA